MKPSPNLLLVEGATEKRLIPELIEHRGIKWKDKDGCFVAQIEEYGGITNMLAPDEIETALKSSGLQALGIIFDADGLHGERDRWPSVRRRCLEIGCEPPEVLPPGGYVTTLASGVRFGIWMMPNNSDGGMLETFLQSLVPNQASETYVYAREATMHAASLGAPFKPAHFDKALIHTWLAWQDPPGCQLHEAVKFKVLNPKSALALPFEQWFRSMFVSS